MFYYSTKFKRMTLHFEGCHHVKSIKNENKAEISSVLQARTEGFRMCKCCSPIQKDYIKNQNEIFDFAISNGIRCYMSRGSMCVQTVREKWLIVATGKGCELELHHKNKYETENDDSVPGYHNQHFRRISVMEMLKYISEHELYRMIHPLQVKKQKLPPKKGTKRWVSQQRTQKKKEKKQQIRNVLNLIDSLAI